MNENRLTLVAVTVKFQNTGFKERSCKTCSEGGKRKGNKFIQRIKNHKDITLFNNSSGSEKALGQCLQNSDVK